MKLLHADRFSKKLRHDFVLGVIRVDLHHAAAAIEVFPETDQNVFRFSAQNNTLPSCFYWCCNLCKNKKSDFQGEKDMKYNLKINYVNLQITDYTITYLRSVVK